MAFVRSLLFYIWLVCYTVAFVAVIAVAVFCSPARRYALMAIWSRWFIKMLGWCCGIRYQVVGSENIPPPNAPPVVFLSRHESTWETIAFQTILPPQAIVLKKELYNIPIFGWGIKLMGMIGIDRNAGRRALSDMREQGQRAMARGLHIIVFPEGQRMQPHETGDFFSGGAWLAKKLQADVIPISVDSGKCWQRRAFIKNAGLITVRIGARIPTQNQSVDQINTQAKQWIDQFVV